MCATRRATCVGDARARDAALARAIVDRSQRYTSERDRPRDAGAIATRDLAARAAFFTIADAMKIAIPLGELAGRGALPARRPLRVVDLGAGCGAMTLGLARDARPATARDPRDRSRRGALRIAAARRARVRARGARRRSRRAPPTSRRRASRRPISC